jgi:hypothetical protein
VPQIAPVRVERPVPTIGATLTTSAAGLRTRKAGRSFTSASGVRAPGVPRALERLKLLHAILENPDSIWMSSPVEKIDYFTRSWPNRWMRDGPNPSRRRS